MVATLEFPDISGVRLPEDSPLLRDYPLREDRRSETYVEKFDRRTLIYDAFRVAPDRVRLVCPRLLNLRVPLSGGLRVDSRPAKVLRHKRSLRYDAFDVAASGTAPLTVEIAGRELPVAIHERPALFNGQNVAFTMVKDTPPDWIVDWARYHVSAHGLEGFLLYDNGTTAYDMRETGERLARETGLKSVAVVSAPFPYGWNAGGRFVAPAKYLQVSLMQIARWRFFGKSRAVLSTDVDELVAPMPDSSVFDVALRARFGLVRLVGQWVYPSEVGPAQPHKNHRLIRPDGKPCQPKWCLAPGKMGDRFEWSVHRPGGPLFPLAEKGGAFWHCRATTTGWKAARDRIPEDAIAHPPLTEAISAHLA